MRSTTRCALALSGAGLILGIGCSGETAPYAGGLMIAVQTDLAAPKDVASVGLFISSDGRPIFGDTRTVAPNGEVKFPATLAVVGDANRPRAVVKIRAVAFKTNGDVRVLRDVITTIPKGRTGLLRTPLLWVNEGSGTGNKTQLVQSASVRPLDATSDGFSRLTSACPDGQTFIQGECADAHIDGDTLPDYSDKDVFGGGDSTGNGGRCFDVLGCFATQSSVELDTSTCKGTLAGVDPNDANLSLAVALPASADTGECRGDTCFVPLDKGTGWKVDGAGFAFAPALCRRIAEKTALGIVAARSCPTKDERTPACGPASAVNPDGYTPEGDAGSAEAEDFDAPIAVTGEPNLSSVVVDAEHIFVARAAEDPPPAGVVRLRKADVLAQRPRDTSMLFGYSSGTQWSTLVRDASSATGPIVVRADSGEIRVCPPTSSNNCLLFMVIGPNEALAVGSSEAYAYGVVDVTPRLYALPFAGPLPLPRAELDGVTLSALHFSNGVLYIGTLGGEILKCPAPCNDANAVSTLYASSTQAPVTAIATSPSVPNKLFFMQLRAGENTPSTGGVFEISTDGKGEFQLATGDRLEGGAGSLKPPSAIAVDSEYVYWGGSFDDPRGGGRRYGLLRRSHRTHGASLPLLEDVQGTDQVSGVAVDDGQVFWTYYRSDRSLMFAKKRRAF